VEGDAIMLVYQGKIIEAHLKKAEITEDELMEAVREHGLSSFKEVDLAIMEVDGNISVLSDKFQKRTTKRRKGRRAITRQQNQG